MPPSNNKRGFLAIPRFKRRTASASIIVFQGLTPDALVGVLWSLWKNLYSPVRKLESKTRVGHRYQKRYDKARTPAQRVLECASVDATQKDRIRHLLATTDCFELKHLLDEKLKDVFDQIRRRKEAALPGLRPLALRAAPSGPVLKPGRAARKARQVVKDTNRTVS